MNHKDTKDTKRARVLANQRSRQVIGSAIEVHKSLGPGLLESVYEQAMCVELESRCVPFQRQVDVSLSYKGVPLGGALKLDLLIDAVVIAELKSFASLQPIHEAQLLTYLRLTGIWLGLLLNFNSVSMRYGIRRRVNNY